jgi:TetR/AcrR family transcriptional regulator
MTSVTVADCSTRERVAATAARLFAERGFAGVSMRDIALAVGMKAASLYNHFADKETLYGAALAHAFTGRVRIVEEALSAAGSPRERLRAMVMALVQATAGDPDAARLLQRELLDAGPGRLERLTRDLFRAPFDRMTALLSELAPGTDGARIAVYLIALVQGLFMLSPLLPFLDDSLPTDTAHFSDGLVEELVMRLGGAVT